MLSWRDLTTETQRTTEVAQRTFQGFLLILCVERTRPGDCDPRESSTTTRFSRRYIVNRLPSVFPCSASSTCAGLPFSTATSSAAVYWHQSPVPRFPG